MRSSEWGSDVCSSDLASKIEVHTVSDSRGAQQQAQLLTGRAAQVLLFLLTMLLAGMVLSNMVEEKTNKIIEILAAAVSIDAIFIGKLMAMLAMSLVGIAIWGSVAFLRSEEHTSELQSLMRISYAVFCLKKKRRTKLRDS